MKDQVEMLTREQNAHPRDVKKVLSELPVQAQESRNSVLDSIAAQEEGSSKNEKGLQRFESALTWTAYAAAVIVAIALTWSVAASISHYMLH